MHFHRDGFAIPNDALQTKSLAAHRAPAATRLTDPKTSVRRKTAANDTALERIYKVEYHTLILAADPFEPRTHDVGSGLVADENLVVEGTKLSAGLVKHRLARRIRQFAVRQVNRGTRAQMIVFLRTDAIEILPRVG